MFYAVDITLKKSNLECALAFGLNESLHQLSSILDTGIDDDQLARSGFHGTRCIDIDNLSGNGAGDILDRQDEGRIGDSIKQDAIFQTFEECRELVVGGIWRVHT